MPAFWERLKKLFVGKEYISSNSATVEQVKLIQHFEKFFGKANYKLTNESDGIDIYVIPATPEKPCNTLFTIGVSKKPMTIPPGMEGYEYCELMIHLPFYWSMDHKPENYWPIEWLRRVAHYPSDNDMWLFYGRSIPGYNNDLPFAENTLLNSFTLGASRMLPSDEQRDQFIMLDVGKGKTVYCFTLLPLYSEEADFLQEHGAEDLFALFDEQELSDIINIRRKNALEGVVIDEAGAIYVDKNNLLE